MRNIKVIIALLAVAFSLSFANVNADATSLEGEKDYKDTNFQFHKNESTGYATYLYDEADL
ncbi:MAG: hypothetical protein II699_07685, partial [Lachnospiraceae bacterium]|nr:hypothetical protein [Lachnospiraceae bacterium]